MPPEILDPGIELIRYLSQYRGPWVTAVLLMFSGMGSTLGYLVLFCMLWWGVSWKLGARLFTVLVLSVYLNAVIKNWVAQPRPFEYAAVESVTRPDEFGFPSGHAQHAALVWSVLAAHFRKRWFTLLATSMAFFIGFSRCISESTSRPTSSADGSSVGSWPSSTFDGTDPRAIG